MHLSSISVKNYKSLKSISLDLNRFALLVGPNGAGKTNMADSLDFLSLVYRHGLEHAVAMKGGYENIASRKIRRARGPIVFRIRADLYGNDIDPMVVRDGVFHPQGDDRVEVTHEFQFQAAGGSIRAEFVIVSETLQVKSDFEVDSERSENSVTISRDRTGKVNIESVGTGPISSDVEMLEEFIKRRQSPMAETASTQLLTESIFGSFISPVRDFIGSVSSITVHQLSPEQSRQEGVPTPDPRLSSTGKNLPAVVDWLQRKRPEYWKRIMNSMKSIVPEIENIRVGYTTQKTLTLFFSEEGVGTPWSADDVSDGTIRSLAMLVTAADPRSSAIILEEPENSVHPWIIGVLLDTLRTVSEEKSVIISTHSPVVINLMRPSEIWIVSKSAGSTSVNRLIDMDPFVENEWAEGACLLADYLAAGWIAEFVPGKR